MNNEQFRSNVCTIQEDVVGNVMAQFSSFCTQALDTQTSAVTEMFGHFCDLQQPLSAEDTAFIEQNTMELQMRLQQMLMSQMEQFISSSKATSCSLLNAIK